MTSPSVTLLCGNYFCKNGGIFLQRGLEVALIHFGSEQGTLKGPGSRGLQNARQLDSSTARVLTVVLDVRCSGLRIEAEDY